MVGLPNCRLHRRVLADLDRPAGKGDTPSLRTDSGARGPAGGAMIMTRRAFITLLCGAVAWPLAARAQQGRPPVVGVLRPIPKDVDQFGEPFRRYMRAIGWEDGRNVRFLFVWAEGRNERAPVLAEQLIAQNVDIIIAFADPAIRAVQRAIQTIPIVGMADDMVGSGLAASMARPGGNTTGVSILSPELDVKRLEILVVGSVE